MRCNYCGLDDHTHHCAQASCFRPVVDKSQSRCVTCRMADAVAYQPETPEPREKQDTLPETEHGDFGGWPSLPLPGPYSVADIAPTISWSDAIRDGLVAMTWAPDAPIAAVDSTWHWAPVAGFEARRFVFDRYLSDEEHNEMMTYLMARYGVTA